MTRVLLILLAVVSLLIGVAADSAVGGSTASPAHRPAAAVSGSGDRAYLQFTTPSRLAAIPNPGTGAGSALLARALLPQPSLGPETVLRALLVRPGVVALPDRDLKSLFIGIRQDGSPVAGPQGCDGWTAGLWSAVIAKFNRRGVQLAVEQNLLTAAPQPVQPVFSEAIISGPPPVIGALADPPLPAACRTITAGSYPGGVMPVATAAPGPVPGPGAVSARAFEVTGTGQNPVWLWAEVIQGRGFLLEIRIPVQYPDSGAGAALAAIAASAYSRAAEVLAAQR